MEHKTHYEEAVISGYAWYPALGNIVASYEEEALPDAQESISWFNKVPSIDCQSEVFLAWNINPEIVRAQGGWVSLAGAFVPRTNEVRHIAQFPLRGGSCNVKDALVASHSYGCIALKVVSQRNKLETLQRIIRGEYEEDTTIQIVPSISFKAQEGVCRHDVSKASFIVEKLPTSNGQVFLDNIPHRQATIKRARPCVDKDDIGPWGRFLWKAEADILNAT